MRPSPPPIGFVLNVYKEVSWTSHDAVSRVRRILGIKKVGHAGSLDPLANGVLLVAVGKATKLVPHLMALPKTYRGTCLLGKRTTTGDSGGAVVEESAVPGFDLEEIRVAARSFVGRTLQVPPMVSAVKQDGRRLYELARKGVEVERRARPIFVHDFRIDSIEPPRVDFTVACGSGTYIRTLVEDLAARLGTLGAVESLTRTAVGGFDVVDASRLISPPGNLKDGLIGSGIAMSEALSHLPRVKVDGRWVHRVRQGGIPPRASLSIAPDLQPDSPVQLVGPEGELLALARLEMLPGPADRSVVESCTLRLDRVI